MTPPQDRTEPVYQQIFSEIRDKIAGGQLEAGSRLPSMRRLAQDKAVSLGTIRHVYSLLEQEGLIELKRGQGSFIAFPQSAQDLEGRKDKALAAIDAMLDRMAELGFSSRESRIFIDLRLRQKEDAIRPIRLAAVADTPEERAVIGSCLDQLGASSAYRLSFQDVMSRPERLAADFDLIAAPVPLAEELKALAPDHLPVMPLALTVSPETLADCRRIPDQSRVGILTVSPAFGQVIRESCRGLLPQGPVQEAVLGDLDRTAAFLDSLDYLLLSPNYANLVEAAELALLRSAEAGGKVFIRTAFTCDQGSFLYLEEAISKRYREMRGS
ncbi:MAG: GntR family transcriptional regulator [Clostridiaceae bacterium]|nr:GntR family transcriptional regulator [Clostridiaceae bacterium]